MTSSQPLRRDVLPSVTDTRSDFVLPEIRSLNVQLDHVSAAADTSTMQLIDVHTAEAYLRKAGLLLPQDTVEISELPGGVSNVVLLVSRNDHEESFVVKQGREKLRVRDDWRCSVERVLREVEVLRTCARVLPEASSLAPAATIPRVLYVDASNYLFAMSAAHPHVTWKQQLLSGRASPETARACGCLLGRLHAGTWRGANLSADLHDQTFFEALRVDPYYRQLARVHPDLRVLVEELITSLHEHRWCLVHGDFSPKNLLVYEAGLMLVDFEVGHFGDPAFDLGFFLSHLVLKAFYRGQSGRRYLDLIGEFQARYRLQVVSVADPQELCELDARAKGNLAACLLARVDGKSPVEYLDDGQRRLVRDLARELLQSDWSWERMRANVHSRLGGRSTPS